MGLNRSKFSGFFLAFVFALASCATKNIEIKNADLRSAEDIKKFLLEKNPSLDCTSLSCFSELTDNQTRFKMLFESEQWEKLARDVLQVNVGQDLTYFYLGRAAEGLELNEVAIRYYLLAKTYPAKCLNIFDGCGGLDFPGVVEKRIKIASTQIKQAPGDVKNTSKVASSESKLIGQVENENLNRQSVTQKPNQNSAAVFFLDITNTTPDSNGMFDIVVTSSADLSEIEVNGERQRYPIGKRVVIKKFAKIGKDSNYIIVAVDINGNKNSKTISVSREVFDSSIKYAQLNPAQVKPQPERDAVAVIIGIADYKNLPRADYANDDARVFYDYAIRALGVKPENIKLLVDSDADEVGIYRAFKTWLPSRVRSTTDVYVYYSGHGLPTADGQGLYLLPQRADRDFIDKTAITQSEINVAIQAAKSKSVTIFLDACYSGQARTGETLLAGARPVSLKADTTTFPDGFTVITASRGDQISSSSPDLKHGIFSYYLMRGMEGDADVNRDGKITVGEMQTYLAENVSRQAGMMNRRQEPQIIGDRSRVLVGR